MESTEEKCLALTAQLQTHKHTQPASSKSHKYTQTSTNTCRQLSRLMTAGEETKILRDSLYQSLTWAANSEFDG